MKVWENLRVCISNKLLADVDVTGSWSTLWEASTELFCNLILLFLATSYIIFFVETPGALGFGFPLSGP